MTGIIGAMDVEVRLLCEQLKDKEVIDFQGYTFNKGTLNGKEVVVVKSGIGKVNAALCAQLLIYKFNADKVINTGIAGATGLGLGIFDFVVSTSTVYHDFNCAFFGYDLGQIPGMDKEFKADSAMIESTLKAFSETEFSKEHKMVKGLIASGDQFISSKEQREFIKTNFNPMCVEMEGSAIAHACTVNKTPFVIIRCMSDMADDSAEATYTFNEDYCAKMCATLILHIIDKI